MESDRGSQKCRSSAASPDDSRAGPSPAAQLGQNRASQDQAPLQRHQLPEPDYPPQHNLQGGLETNCSGFDQSPPRSRTSIASACRFTCRIIASARLFTQPGPTASFAAARQRTAFASAIYADSGGL